jgi:hypothetical protein
MRTLPTETDRLRRVRRDLAAIRAAQAQVRQGLSAVRQSERSAAVLAALIEAEHEAGKAAEDRLLAAVERKVAGERPVPDLSAPAPPKVREWADRYLVDPEDREAFTGRVETPENAGAGKGSPIHERAR